MDPDQGQEPLLPFHLQDNPANPYNGRPLSSQTSYYPQQQHQQLSEEGVFPNQGQLLSPIDQQQQQHRQQQSLEQVHHIRSPNEYSNYLASDLHKAHSTPQQQQQQHHQQMQQQMQQQQQMQELGPSLGTLHHHHQQQAGHHHFQSPQQQQQQHPYYPRRHQHDPHQHDPQRQDDLRQQQRHLLPHQPMYSSTPSLEQQQQHGQLYMQPHQQPHQISDTAAADPSTPASTATSTMTSGSAASTPLLPSTASLLSPVAFHVPALAQNQGQGQNMGSNLASPPSEPQPGALQPLGMHALSWTTTPATPEQLPNTQDVAQSKRQQQTFLGSDAQQAHAHDHAHDNASAHAHGHGHHPLSPLPPPLSTTLAQAHGHPPSQHPQQQMPARDSPSSPSQAQLLSQGAQDQHHHHHHHQQQQPSQMWVGMNSDSAFHSPDDVLGQQQQQQARPSLKQSRSFGMESMEHQNQSYPPGYTDHQGMATAMQRHRVQSARQVFARNLMDYTDDYSLGQGQGHPHHQQQQHQPQQHSPGTPLTPQPHGGLPTLVELPMLPSSQLLQQDPQGFAAMSMSMMHQKTMSSPASLGPMAMGFHGDGSHPSMMGAHSQDYSSPTDVVSYPMPLHHGNQHHRPISSRPPSRNAQGGGSGGPGSIRPTPPNTLHRTSSAGPGPGALSVRPSRRLRTSSMNAVPTSSFGSRSLLSSITSSLGATSLTFPEYPTSSSSSIPLTSIQAAQQGGGGGGVHGREGSGGLPTIAIGLESHNDLNSPTPGGLDYTRYSRSDGSSSMSNLGGGHRFGNRISTAAGAASMSKSSPSGLSISTSSSSPLQFSSAFGTSNSASASSSSSSSAKSTTTTTTLSNFMASHMSRKQTAIRNFACSFPGCPKAYTQLHNLKSHERTGHTPVTKPKPFLCIIPGCPKAFSQRKSLAIHIKANHKEYRYKPFKCGQVGCPKAYTQLHNLRTHEKTVHSLDLSRKRIRIPTPPRAGGGGGGSSSGGRTMGGHPYQSQDPASGGGGGGGGGMDYGVRGLSQSQRDMGLSYGHEANDDDDEEEEEEDDEEGDEDNEDLADGDWRDEDGDGGQYGGPR